MLQMDKRDPRWSFVGSSYVEQIQGAKILLYYLVRSTGTAKNAPDLMQKTLGLNPYKHVLLMSTGS